MCYKLHKIHIYGAIDQFEGQISVFNYKNGPKYSDIYPKNLRLKDRKCSNLGVLGLLTGIIGILQATEAIKIITGIGTILTGKILIYNALYMSFKTINIKHIIKSQIEVKYTSINTKKIILNKNLKKTILHYKNVEIIDVRQKLEYKKQHIIRSINIPLKEIVYKYNIQYIEDQAKDKTIIIYCSKNSRSILASHILDQYDIDHIRLYNGILSLQNQ